MEAGEIIKRKYHWFCSNCGSKIDFDIVTNVEDNRVPIFAMSNYCDYCKSKFEVIINENRIVKIINIIDNPLEVETDDDRLH